MKFANLILDDNKGMENVGDWAQILAIEHLFYYMNVKNEEIVRIKISELSSYDGEYVILPINFPLYGYYTLSPKIIPVFLGISVIHNSVADGLRMKNFQPIGCRDYHTWKELTNCGIEAYMAGCLTITMPKREVSKSQKKIFIVDVSDKIYNKVPLNIRDMAERTTHIFYCEECGGEEGAKKIYQRYKEEAALVITSRIHCAQPCLAMGIPVIFVCEVCSFRYDVLRQYIPIYTLDTMDQIDWNPTVPDLEEHKKALLKNAADRVMQAWEKYESMCRIGDFYCKGEPIVAEIDSIWAFQRYILSKWSRDESFYYSVWGITQVAESIYDWIHREYPKAILDKVIDIARTDSFHGVQPETTAAFKNCDSVVFVTAGSANPVAVETFKKYGVRSYVICYNGLYIVDGEERMY